MALVAVCDGEVLQGEVEDNASTTRRLAKREDVKTFCNKLAKVHGHPKSTGRKPD